MSTNNITYAFLSISAPGTSLIPGDISSAVSLTRRCNAFLASLKQTHPTRFGYFASLPLPHADAAIEEIGKALDEGADGFLLLSNYHGIYPGDSRFSAVFTELEQRKAVVMLHPSTPCMDCVSQYPATQPGEIVRSQLANTTASTGKDQEPQQKPAVMKATPLMDTYRSPMFEFLFDTTRAVIHLLLSLTVQRCPSITFIVPHCGSCLPSVFSRATAFASLVPSSFASMPEDEARAVLQRQFYFDLAGWAFPGQIWGLVKGLGIRSERLLYGTDYCFTVAKGVEKFVMVNDKGMPELFSEEEIESAYWRNARKLFKLGDGKIEEWKEEM